MLSRTIYRAVPLPPVADFSQAGIRYVPSPVRVGVLSRAIYMPENVNPRLISTAECARRLGIDPRTAKSWRDCGKIVSVILPDGSIRVPESEIVRLTTGTDLRKYLIDNGWTNGQAKGLWNKEKNSDCEMAEAISIQRRCDSIH